MVAETIASSHCTLSMEGWPGWVAWINTGIVDSPNMITNPSQARRSLTLLIWPKSLPLRQTINHVPMVELICKQWFQEFTNSPLRRVYDLNHCGMWGQPADQWHGPRVGNSIKLLMSFCNWLLHINSVPVNTFIIPAVSNIINTSQHLNTSSSILLTHSKSMSEWATK